MKTTIFVETESAEKLALLIKVAREMGIITHLTNDTFEPVSEEEENKLWKALAQREMAKDWLHPDEDAWDDFIKSNLKE